MKKLLNFGVSDPLTLGMAHPIADRLESLGRARPTTWGSRCLALSAMSVLALATAPLSVASDHPEETKSEARFKFISNLNGKTAQSYEIVTEDGERKAYRILENGDREAAKLDKNEDGAYRLTYSDGQTVDLPNIHFDGLEGLKDLKNLESLAGLKNLEGLKALSTDIHVFELDESDFSDENSKEILVKLPKNIREMIESIEGSKDIKILKSGDFSNKFKFSNKEGGHFSLPDSIVDMDFLFEEDENPLGSAQRQLERAKRQLEALSEDEDLTFDLQNALRDIESARKSLDEASRRLDNDSK